MNKFNYSKLHIFDKNGVELPLNIESSAKIVISNNLGDDAVFYPITDKNNNIVDYYKQSSGSRFNGNSSTLNCDFGGQPARASVSYLKYTAIGETEDGQDEYAISKITSIDSIPIELEYPSIKFNSYLNFNVISTELVETQSLYVLAQNETTGEYETIYDYDSSWGSRYELLFFIDCRNQTDFRFFNVENDELVWSNKVILNLSSSEESGCRVNIGFCSEQEGIFKEPLYICILDRGENKELSLEEADITFLGTIELQAETIGEDERYRTLFTNFGIPDPITYPKLFTNTSVEEDKIDYIKLNQNSKKLFLEYANIFPYAGTYKALANAIKVLGYDDIFFKEWYKKIDATSSRLMSYDITYNSDLNANVINNVSLKERIHLKKLNWLSMVYRINQEIINSVEDKYGFPAVENKYDFNHEDIIVKLISLRDWLQKYIVGLNCRIIDVGGEGIYFERYKLGAYGSYQTAYEWNNEQDISPFIVDTNDNILIDSSADIYVNLGINEKLARIEDFEHKRFIDFAEGYFTEDSSYHIGTDDNDKSILWVGKTLTSFTDLNRYQIKAYVSTKNFMFSHSDKVDECYIDSSSSRLVISDNKMFLNPLDIHNGKLLSANFVKHPYIYIKKAILYPYYPEQNNDWLNSKIANSSVHIEANDYCLLYPTATAEFSYKEDPYYEYPVLMFKNYNVSSIIEESEATEYIIEILDGKILFNESSDDYDKLITVNIQYNNTSDKHITTNIVYLSNEVFPKKYNVGTEYISNFVDEELYPEFISLYQSNPEQCIDYNFVSNIKVNYAGTYNVDVIGKDLYNNIFAAPCKNSVVIGTPQYNSIAYTNTYGKDTPISASLEEKLFIKNNYINYCIYNKEYAVPFTKDTSLGNVQYSTYSYAIDSPKEGDYVHFSNKQEKFELYGESPITSTGASTSKSYTVDEVVYNACQGYDLVLKRKNATPVYDYSENENNVNVIFYNELGAYPIFQIIGTLKNQGNDIYNLSIKDDTREDFVWACADNLAGLSMAQDLAQLSLSKILVEGSPYIDNEFIINLLKNGYINMFTAIGDLAIDVYTSEEIGDRRKIYTVEERKNEEGETESYNAYLQNKRFNTIDDVIEEAAEHRVYDVNSYIATLAKSLKMGEDDSISYPFERFYTSISVDLASNDTLFFTDSIAVQNLDRYFIQGAIKYGANNKENNILNEYHQEYDASINEYIDNNILPQIPEMLSTLNISNFNEFVINDELIASTVEAVIKYSAEYDSDPSKIGDNAVLSIKKMQKFVEAEFKQYAFDDTYDPIGFEGDIYQPLMSLTDEIFINELSSIWEKNIANLLAYRTCVIYVYTAIGYLLKKYLNDSKMNLSKYVEGLLDWNTNEEFIKNSIISSLLEYFFNLGSSDDDLVGRGFRGLFLITPYEWYDKKNDNDDKELRVPTNAGESLRIYTLTKEYTEAQATSGWIFTHELEPSSVDTGMGRKRSFYYAVAYYNEEDNTYYYIRTKSMADISAKYLNNTFDGNFIFDLNILLNCNEIGIYIEPIDKTLVHIQDKRYEEEAQINIENDGEEEKLKENEMRVIFADSKNHMCLQEGDMIKLIFNSVNDDSLIAQSSYKISKVNENDCIITGDINYQYIRVVSGYVFYKIEGFSDSSINYQEIKTLNLTVDEEHNTHIDVIEFKDVSTGKVFYVTNELENTNPIDWYALLRNDNGWIRIRKDFNSEIDISMSYAHWAYVDYVLKALSSNESAYPSIAIKFDDTKYNNLRLNFADSKFVLNSRPFDTNEGIAGWMDLAYPAEAIKNPLGGTPRITRSNYIYRYDNTTRNPIVTQSSPNLVYCVDNMNPNGYVYWRIYKHSTVANELIYEFESFNNVLYLDINVPGIYDIEMNVFDKFGNLSRNMIKGAFQVI